MGGNELLDEIKTIFNRVEDSLCELNQRPELDITIKKDIYLLRLNLMIELVELEKRYR